MSMNTQERTACAVGLILAHVYDLSGLSRPTLGFISFTSQLFLVYDIHPNIYIFAATCTPARDAD